MRQGTNARGGKAFSDEAWLPSEPLRGRISPDFAMLPQGEAGVLHIHPSQEHTSTNSSNPARLFGIWILVSDQMRSFPIPIGLASGGSSHLHISPTSPRSALQKPGVIGGIFRTRREPFIAHIQIVRYVVSQLTATRNSVAGRRCRGASWRIAARADDSPSLCMREVLAQEAAMR